MPLELARMQRWMQGAIIAEDPLPATQARRRILPSKTLRPEQRLDIYRNMYEARLHDALAADYPRVLKFLGQDRFRELVHLYLQAHPSSSYTLNRLGDLLPDFIRNELKGAPRPGFLYDLARYELAQTMVFDEEESPSLTSGQIAAVPAEAWPRARMEMIPALRLMRLGYPVHRHGKKIPRKTTWLAVYRNQYAVSALELTGQSYNLLGALASGKPLEEALQGVPASRRSVTKWFARWTGAGLFRKISICWVSPSYPASRQNRRLAVRR